MSILITGSTGQLGQELKRVLQDYDLITPTHQDLDINDKDIIQRIIKLKPKIIIHTAAYTDVDGCERNQELAWNVNCIGTKNIAIAAEELNSKLFYISTDYVFDGKKNEAYLESDQPNPVNVYGKSKLSGETLVRDICTKFFIIRTSWLYSKTGRNFVNTILELARVKDELRVVNDQIGSPTYAMDLANVVKRLLPIEKYGIYHASGEGECSWYEFANEILRLSRTQVKVEPITSDEISRPAKRPHYSVLNNYCLRQIGITMRHWQECLKDCFVAKQIKQ